MGRAVSNVVPLRKPKMMCSACGASATAACDCGKPYIPASTAAAKAVQAHPEKSDRAIAAGIGVDHKTVSKARKATGEKSPVEKRTGRDGKVRKMPKKSKAKKAKPQNDIARSKDFTSRVNNFVCAVAEEYEKWLQTEPDLPDEALQSLVNMFNVSAAQLQSMAEAAADMMEE